MRDTADRVLKGNWWRIACCNHCCIPKGVQQSFDFSRISIGIFCLDRIALRTKEGSFCNLSNTLRTRSLHGKGEKINVALGTQRQSSFTLPFFFFLSFLCLLFLLLIILKEQEGQSTYFLLSNFKTHLLRNQRNKKKRHSLLFAYYPPKDIQFGRPR